MPEAAVAPAEPESLFEALGGVESADPPVVDASPPVETEPAVAESAAVAEPVAAGEPVDDPVADYRTFVDYAKDVAPEFAGTLGKYTTLEAALKGLAEQQRLFGEGQNALGYVRQLQQAGVTDEQIKQLIQGRTAAAGNGSPEPLWQKGWLAGHDKEGKPLFSASAPADAQQRLDRYMAAYREAVYGGQEALREFLAVPTTKDIEAATLQVRQETQAQQQARSMQEAHDGWLRTNAKHLYEGGVTGAALTPLAQQMQDLLWPGGKADDSEINPNWGPARRLQAAFDRITVAARPTAAAPVVKPKGQHQPGAAGAGKKLTSGEWLEKNPDANMQGFANAVVAGEIA